MLVLEWIGIGFLILLVGLGVLFLRRAVLLRIGGTIRLQMRLTATVPERGWASGFGRFAGDDLRWHRMFSLAIRPKRIISRTGLVILSRRNPAGQELFTLPGDFVIIRCQRPGQEAVEIAMATSTLTGFLSWLESAPPGEVQTRLAAM